MARSLIREVTLEERQALVEDANTNGCTLDGQRAYVGGYMKDFATVGIARSGLSVQFAWATVAHILSTHRSFKS